MARLSKCFCLCLVAILAVSMMLMIQSVDAQSSPVIIVTPTPEPLSTPTPTQAPTRNIAMDYSEMSRASEGENTRLVLAVNASYYFGEPVTISFQDFTLNIAVERGGPLVGQPENLFTGTAKPNETGKIILDESNSELAFQLTFIFSTLQNNAHGQTPFTIYELVYSGSTTGSSPSPSVPELSWVAIVPLLLSIFAVALVFRYRKTVL